MNNNTMVVSGIIVLVLVLVGGLVVYSSQNDALPSSDTSTTTPETVDTAGSQEVPKAGTPIIVTRNASGATKSTATLHGTVNENSADVTYWFEYSSDPLLGAVLNRTTPKVTINANTNGMSVSADVSGLSSSTTYYFRIVAQNSAGTVLGDRMSFKTK